jgi:hypothetical protein
LLCIFKLVSILDIFVPTLLDPCNTLLVAVIVGAVILPELIVPVVILLVEVNVACFVFKLVSIFDVFVRTLLDQDNKLLVAVIVGAVILPEFIVPVVILLDEVDIFCFASTCVCNKDKPLSIFTPFIIALFEVILLQVKSSVDTILFIYF